MGVTDTKAIVTHIDTSFKSIRKYNDNFYGQITLVQQKSTGKLFALVQKVIIITDESLKQYFHHRKQQSPYLVRLHTYYNCSIDYCSGLQKYFLLLQYSDHTLYHQMILRQQQNKRFTSDELFNIFSSYLEMTSFLKDKNHFFTQFISNHLVLYQQSHELKTLENIFKVDNDQFQFDFHLIRNNQSNKELYLAPQAYRLLCNKQKFQAKNVSLTEKAIVFMLGMNFIQCALLADISAVYNSYQKSIRFDKLKKGLQQIKSIYGEDMFQMISQMVAENSNQRPSIQELKDYMKLNLKRRKIVIPKHTKAEHIKPKQLRV